MQDTSYQFLEGTYVALFCLRLARILSAVGPSVTHTIRLCRVGSSCKLPIGTLIRSWPQCSTTHASAIGELPKFGERHGSPPQVLYRELNVSRICSLRLLVARIYSKRRVVSSSLMPGRIQLQAFYWHTNAKAQPTFSSPRFLVGTIGTCHRSMHPKRRMLLRGVQNHNSIGRKERTICPVAQFGTCNFDM